MTGAVLHEDSRIGRAFAEFHAANPDVYANLLRFARIARNAGFRRYGMKSLFERLRWHQQIETSSVDFKINNNFTSRYARLIEEQEPEFVGFFEKRELLSERSWRKRNGEVFRGEEGSVGGLGAGRDGSR